MSQSSLIAPATRALILAHYERYAPYFVESFSLAPVVPTYYIHGLGHDATYGGSWHHAIPHTLHSVDVGDPAKPLHYEYAAQRLHDDGAVLVVKVGRC